MTRDLVERDVHAPDWSEASRSLAVSLTALDGSLRMYALVNAWWEPLDFMIPETRPETAWRTLADTYDLAAPAASETAGKAGDHVTVGPRSIVVLLNAGKKVL